MQKIFAIIVTYNPNFNCFLRLLDFILADVNTVIIIDNGSSQFKELEAELKNRNVLVCHNQDNIGVAAAYNQGIKLAKKFDAERIVLFDQDSCPSHNMITILNHELVQAQQAGLKVAALGPQYYDEKFPDVLPFVKIEGLGIRRIACTNTDIVEVDHLISSGCMIDVEALSTIGFFEEKLFIDYVDTEWCLRAKLKGFVLLGVGAAHMRHNLGDSYLTFFGKRVPQHSALRHYYLMRNGVWLLGQSWVGWKWRVVDGFRLCKIFLFFSICSSNPALHFKMMLLGFIDSLFGVMGKFNR